MIYIDLTTYQVVLFKHNVIHSNQNQFLLKQDIGNLIYIELKLFLNRAYNDH